MPHEPVIGLEVHAELAAQSKMFCACAVVDNTVAPPNSAVCPVCAGMPGALPVVNQMAVEMGLRAALALGCAVNPASVFARKNYFYPDLPKGYQISQYEQPLAEHGRLVVQTRAGERTVRIRRVHLEEDTGKLTHTEGGSLLDLNRAGVPLLEIVSEPDMRSAEEAVAYGEALRHILRYLEVNSGDMEKGVIRFEANVSVRLAGAEELGTRTEVKNLNSFRALERAIEFEIDRQSKILASGGTVEQETLGWDEARERTYSQRSKEDAHDYRYFPEPDLPPLKVDAAWLERVRAELPELPRAKMERFAADYKLPVKDAARLAEEKSVADYFEATVSRLPASVPPKTAANWMLGDLFGLMKTRGETADRLKVRPEALAELVSLVAGGEINQTTGRGVLAEMSESGKSAAEIVAAKGLKQVSDAGFIAAIVRQTLEECPDEAASYRSGKEAVLNFLFGQVMKKAAGKANPQAARAELERQLKA
ncbi:MAG: aspartyl/glutamyl-tRNA(Asn/Gln) amidotransferase subunit B [Anaerolineaceae bacterium]|nr:Asp-tRNA(Asn)/Glu-tRNA(Gln) amidotransferase subunit GatB [Anaerolineae bacterium]MBL1172161.1 Asp-tRNA(Asn)/Glu-tRNA(Gln) amidotransferase subunit GatB [Chloroflexota bacterium]MCL4823091.1 Asp-tRNA(Asn)/Glu-tRNA(Gln) amidotransferase subunit GatB [Anaerolineales bacterium]MDL1925914.1 Asp-tRNA(Asn)/Glu-tRNA(Gln) amidotransferase subunit GatB [Anaerolineae bacterium AMX1]GJQ38768.1 MAG: aspartyl/glutamyl-tRNA(Asn/Gln) amidotransferase subunit B [Anaerolineaceae bacterium]